MDDWAAGFVTRSPILKVVLEDARRIARTDSDALITGAAGTGKETLARAIHAASARATRPFVVVTTQNDHAGLFRSAEGGSVFLDEIGDRTSEQQVRLLRLLQETQGRPAGARVLAATRTELEARVASGAFRRDLYDRLNGAQLRLPGLDERREDIAPLVARRLQQLADGGAPRRVYSPEAMEMLVAAAWPGNVRQLFGAVEQHAGLSPGRVISAALVRRSLGDPGGGLPSFDEARAEFTRTYLRQVLELAGGNISRAARLAGRNRTDLYKLLHRHGISPSEFKARRRDLPGVRSATH
ncbi:MAG: sigma 54-interacting transcriptional regulator [Nevskiaceae bacterium]